MIIDGKKSEGERKESRMTEKDPKIKSSDTPRFKIAQRMLDSQWGLRKSVKELSRQSKECGTPEIRRVLQESMVTWVKCC